MNPNLNTYHRRFLSIEERFWNKVDKASGYGPKGDCWEWIGGRMHHKDPRFCYGQCWRKGINCMAHRVAFELAHNVTVLPEVNVCHSCDNPPCVNPNHLFLGDDKDNAQDRSKKGRNNSPIGERQGRSKLKERDILVIHQLREEGLTVAAIADRYGVHRETVGRILRGVNWKHTYGIKE